MSVVLTLVASDPARPVEEDHAQSVLSLVRDFGVQPICQPGWIKKDKAVDLGLSEHGGREMLEAAREALDEAAIDVFINPVDKRRKKLVLADMDSTIVEGETLDDLAAHAGIKDQIAAITARAMNGELDFEAALQERVGLLKGLEKSAIDETLAKMRLNPGAEEFITVMREKGAHCVLVSGGFTLFTGAVARQLGFHAHHGNELILEDGRLSGRVKHPILDKSAKVHVLKGCMERFGFQPEDCLTIGDGANDLPMLKMAGLGIGYKPKPAVAEEIDNLIIHGDLSAALYAQGLAS